VTIGSRIPTPRRLLIGWLGIRGIGSLNYLAYAATHGLGAAQATRVAGLVVTVVALSIVVHGITTPPLMAWRQARLRDRATQARASNGRRSTAPVRAGSSDT
jgi:NhaP-type Na+/H+ or K+/H+ antiporter